MKTIRTILTIILFSQMAQSQNSNDSYESLWIEVEQLEKEALTKSASELVSQIFARAKKEDNPQQIVRSLLYRSKYALTLEEDAMLNIVEEFKGEIDRGRFPTKNILQSYLANLYWQYFQINRYKIYNRSHTENKVDPVDFRTWDLLTLFEEIGHHFDGSMDNSKELQQLPIGDYKVLITNQKGSKTYRPTLFDLLAHNALSFYKTNENSITRPADTFELNDPELLCEAVDFIGQEISTQDNTALQAKALCIYQQLLQFHYTKGNRAALVEVDIERLNFVHQNATFPNKDHNLIETLQNSVETQAGHSINGLYNYEIASKYHSWGNTYNPKENKQYQWKQKEAIALCSSVIDKFPNSRAAQKCKDLKSTILQKQLQLMAEQFVPINTPSRILVTYKNLDDLKLTAYKASKNDLKKLERLYPNAKKRAFIEKLKVSKEWKASLKNENDHQTHRTEILLPSLENGLYVILAKPADHDTSFAYSTIQLTDLALIESTTPTHHSFQIIDRNNGEPKKVAVVKLTFQLNHDGKSISKDFITDQLGMVKIPLPKNNWTSVGTKVTIDGDTAYFGDFYINRKQIPKATHNINYTAFLFTDRSIYRPNQPLHFKGIAIKRENEISTVQSNTKVAVILRDANNREVSRQTFTTNDFGSFAGEFIIPNNGLLGNYSMQVKAEEININGATDFSVEEYKRPKFETTFDPITTTYKINDSVTLKGKAIAFAGSNITNAKVVYRVKRAVNFPRWYYWLRPYINSTAQEIAHGECLTDASGTFEIKFKAIPDTTIDKKDMPVFNYELTAEVTDINGETRNATTTVRVGYHALEANLIIDPVLDKDSKVNTLNITTQNLNGQFVEAKGTIEIYKLKAPSRVLRKRPWEAPDYTGFEESKFNTLFPHDAFNNEHDPTTWKKGKKIYVSEFDSGKSTSLSLGNTKTWISGQYAIELKTVDRFGQKVQDIVYTNVYDTKDRQLADKQLFQIKTDKERYQIGDRVKLTLYSNVEDLAVTIYVEKDRKLIDTQIIYLNKTSKSVELPVGSSDLGGFAVNYSFSAYNSFYSDVVPIAVPYPKTALEIETKTFRDKLQPGTEETWTFKIKGPKGEKVSSELLASMYDASLDTFRDHQWNFNPLYRPNYYYNLYCNAGYSFGTRSFNTYNTPQPNGLYRPQLFDSFNWFGLHLGYGMGRYNQRRMMKSTAPMATNMAMDEESELAEEDNILGLTSGNDSVSVPIDKMILKTGNHIAETKKETTSNKVQIRKNLQETAFFFPQLLTDDQGNVSFSFTTPEALTKWKLQLLAHTKSLESTTTSLETVTQKELMVIPNAPRFLREGDEIVISAKIANLTQNSLAGTVWLELNNAINGQPITPKMILGDPNGPQDGKSSSGQQSFQVDSLGNTQASWRLGVPSNVQALQYKIIAKAEAFSDGEQNVLPVLTNRMLVTETLPMWVRGQQSKTFVLDKLRDNTSTTLKHHRLTLEISTNPAWYAVQALPYLMEYPHDCNEQVFSRYYANTLASYIANNNPKIQEVFKAWGNSDALLSNLEKNQELKSVLIQETPWLRDAQSETEQKKRIALLFDLNKMRNEQSNTIHKLSQNQMSSGAWAWFKGGRANRFITQHIVAGFGHLKRLTPKSTATATQDAMVKKALVYLDQQFIKEYDDMKRYSTNLNDDHLSHTQLHYLYTRSFFKDIKTSKKVANIIDFYLKQAQRYWTRKSLYSKGLLALALHRNMDGKNARKILRSLKENSITSEELGMYWKDNTTSWHWHQAPIETQALLIEAFSEIENDTKIVDNLKIWLLKHKQTNQWKTTKATTEAVYALLLQGTDWLALDEAVEINIGETKIDPAKYKGTDGNSTNIEAGTGYSKISWNSQEIQPKLAEVRLSKKGSGIVWGALYWQYFENLDKINTATTPLHLEKKLFLRNYTANGEQLSKISTESKLNVGDLIRVRIELKADRPMEFVHMKDMRAAGFEPLNVRSSYKWQDGLGYYESTKDASTNFFFDYLPKGVFVFEYDLRINNAGDFSNGVTTIQSMYAPEFSSHSEGTRIGVDGFSPNFDVK